jgi:hypothetical protein
MRGVILPLPQYAIMAWCLVKKKHRDNFAFTFRHSLANTLTCKRRVTEEFFDVVVGRDALVRQRDATGEAATGGVQ